MAGTEIEWDVEWSTAQCRCPACRNRRRQESDVLLREVLKDADLSITVRLWPEGSK